MEQRVRVRTYRALFHSSFAELHAPRRAATVKPWCCIAVLRRYKACLNSLIGVLGVRGSMSNRYEFLSESLLERHHASKVTFADHTTSAAFQSILKPQPTHISKDSVRHTVARCEPGSGAVRLVLCGPKCTGRSVEVRLPSSTCFSSLLLPGFP